MSKKRDYIAEIEAIRGRKQSGVNTELVTRLFSLQRAFEARSAADAEMMRYFPVALVACIEGYARAAIAELVDAGDPYLANSGKLELMKIDFSILRAIHGKTVSVGELVAHSVSLSRLGDVDAHLSTITGENFLKKLSRVCDRWLSVTSGEPERPMLDDPSKVFAGVARTFELRHIICHETASAYTISVEEIENCFESCVLFLTATLELLFQTLLPNAPLTQMAMNDDAAKSLAASEAVCAEALYDARKRVADGEMPAFDEAQTRWEEFANAWVHFVVGPQEGSIWPMLYARASEHLVNKRIEILKEWRRPYESGSA